MKKKMYGIAAAVSCAAAGITKIITMINHGSSYNLAYLQTVHRVSESHLKMIKEKDGFYALYNPQSGPVKILQLSDLHIGGGYLSRHEDRLVFKTIYSLVEKHKPDLIILTGDLFCSKPSISLSRNNKNSLIQIVMLLERMGIPYAVTFGNKDSVFYATHSRKKLREYLLKQSHCLMAWDGEEITGCSNYFVKIRNQKQQITNVLYFMDTNEVVGSRIYRKKYDSIHDDQVDWYRRKVKSIEKESGRNVPSCMFMHMPLPEYAEAWRECQNGGYRARLLGGKVNETISRPQLPSKMFSMIEKLQSTKAVFCGHDHLNHFSIWYRGVRLVCGKSLDYIMYGKNISGHRGGTLFYLMPNGNVKIRGE